MIGVPIADRGDGLALRARSTRAANGRDWFVFRTGEWTLAVWRDERRGYIEVAPSARVDDRPGEVLGEARLDPDLVGTLPIAIPVDPILERVAAYLWRPAAPRDDARAGPGGEAIGAALSAELAAGLADALASPTLIEEFRAIGRELDDGPRPT